MGIIEILWGVLLVSFTIIGTLFGRWISKVDKKQDQHDLDLASQKTSHDKDMKEMKENYITRFDGVNSRLSDVEKNIIKEISNLKDYLNDNFVRKENCENHNQ
jgi:hypothetical protein